ncbi:MAG: hypothetical protein E4G94_03810 [ANME-2 cluster archaeon]|nr:MAG: hypothetical protein E4G94_03810 [ANME-2 cluster archaeon]
MERRKIIMWMSLYILAVSLLSTGAEAQELTEVNASDILEKIKNGEDIYLENVHIIGELDLNKIELETLPIERSTRQIQKYDLDDELKLIENEIIILVSLM